MGSAASGAHIEYPVGSYVLVSYPDSPPDKLRTVWQGLCKSSVLSVPSILSKIWSTAPFTQYIMVD